MSQRVAASEKELIGVGIYRFKGEPGPEYRLEKIKVGSGTLMKIDETRYPHEVLLLNTYIDTDMNNLIGLHVLIELGEQGDLIVVN